LPGFSDRRNIAAVALHHRLAQCEIVEPICIRRDNGGQVGEGVMGEVYRTKDSSSRTAIKLPTRWRAKPVND